MEGEYDHWNIKINHRDSLNYYCTVEVLIDSGAPFSFVGAKCLQLLYCFFCLIPPNFHVTAPKTFYGNIVNLSGLLQNQWQAVWHDRVFAQWDSFCLETEEKKQYSLDMMLPLPPLCKTMFMANIESNAAFEVIWQKGYILFHSYFIFFPYL